MVNRGLSLAALNTSPVTGPELQNAPLKRTTYKQMPGEMPLGSFVQTQVRPRRTGERAERNNWHCLDSSDEHHVSLYPRPPPPAHTSLQIGEYMNILHCTQCHYQAGLCQNIPPSQNISSSSLPQYFFNKINPQLSLERCMSVTSLEASFSPTPYLR